jgi:hypothetical protein
MLTKEMDIIGFNMKFIHENKKESRQLIWLMNFSKEAKFLLYFVYCLVLSACYIIEKHLDTVISRVWRTTKQSV